MAGLREPVGDDQRGAAVEDALRGRLEGPGSGAAGFGTGLVEDRDRRVVQREAGERDLLRLRRRERVATLADLGLEQLVAPVRSGLLQGALELLVGRVGPGQPQVGGERAGEDVDLPG